MKHLKRLCILLMLLTVITGSRVFAQDYFSSLNPFNQIQKSERAKDVMQDNEYTSTGYEQGNFYDNPLMLNGEPLDYNMFGVGIKGTLTVVKGAPVTGRTMKIPFLVYLRRDGGKVTIPGMETPDPKQLKVDISEIMKSAKPGDQLVIEAINREDGSVKRILKVPKDGC